jgi:hypothetical protein
MVSLHLQPAAPGAEQSSIEALMWLRFSWIIQDTNSLVKTAPVVRNLSAKHALGNG